MKTEFHTFLIAMLLLTCGCFEQAEVTTGQTDSDRIADINHVASIMEEYKGLYGKYPLYEAWENGRYQPTVYIRITDHALSDDERFMPGVTCTSLTKAFFEDYLSKHLHRTIKLPVDERPLNVSEGYQFVFDGKIISSHAPSKRLPTELADLLMAFTNINCHPRRFLIGKYSKSKRKLTKHCAREDTHPPKNLCVSAHIPVTCLQLER